MKDTWQDAVVDDVFCTPPVCVSSLEFAPPSPALTASPQRRSYGCSSLPHVTTSQTADLLDAQALNAEKMMWWCAREFQQLPFEQYVDPIFSATSCSSEDIHDDRVASASSVGYRQCLAPVVEEPVFATIFPSADGREKVASASSTGYRRCSAPEDDSTGYRRCSAPEDDDPVFASLLQSIRQSLLRENSNDKQSTATSTATPSVRSRGKRYRQE